MAVDRLEFGKTYYEIGHVDKNNNKNYKEIKAKYPNLRCVFGIVGVVNADDYDVIVKSKDKSYENFITYKESDFGLKWDITDIKPSYSLYSSVEEAEERCEFLNNSLVETFEKM